MDGDEWVVVFGEVGVVVHFVVFEVQEDVVVVVCGWVEYWFVGDREDVCALFVC